jgi:hypothetical protein
VLPTDLLLRLMNATPEQIAAVREILGLGEEFECEPASDDVAREVFDVIRRIELPARDRKAPLVKVFQLYYVDGLTAATVAKKCRCSRRLIVIRLQQLSRKLGRKPSQLRALTHAQEMH